MLSKDVSPVLLKDVSDIGGVLYDVSDYPYLHVMFPTVREAIAKQDSLEMLMRKHDIALAGMAEKAIRCNPRAREVRL